MPVFAELIRQAAQGSVLYNDDTTARILALTQEARAEALPAGASADRSGVFTSGVVAETAKGLIALFKTLPFARSPLDTVAVFRYGFAYGSGEAAVGR